MDLRRYPSASASLYKAAGTPVTAAWRGVKSLALGLFPWLLDVYEKVVRALRKAIPFVGGFLWGAVMAAGASIAVGSVTLARPVFESLINPRYGGSRVSGPIIWLGRQLSAKLI